MNLSELQSMFSPTSGNFRKGSFFQKHIIDKPETDDKNFDVVIIGIPDDEKGKVFDSSDEIRKELYKLSALSKKFRILDLGNLTTEESLNHTFGTFKAAIDKFQNQEIKIIIIGGASIYNKPVISSYLTNQIPLNQIWVDSRITWEHFPTDSMAIEIKDSFEGVQSNFINIACQSYFVEPEIHEYIQDNNFETYRLGLVRSRVPEFEPVLRDANVINFNFNAVKFSDAPGAKYTSPNGLTGDEFCQLAYYAGFSNHLKIFGIYDLIVLNDNRSITSALGGQALWYLFEGMANKIYEDPELTPEHFTKYHIHLDTANQNISFYQSAITKRWWMEIELEPDSRKIILSSSEKDYELACKQEIPDRWWRLFNRIQ